MSLSKPRFALIGAAGYVAPRHLAAIAAVGGELAAAVDPSDSVGILDHYFPDAAFFTEFERFDRHLDKLKRTGRAVDYVVVCSPNYLHDAHCRFGLRYGADVICEKPLVLNPWNLDALAEMENQTGGQIYNILQLRLHPNAEALRAKVAAAPATVHEVDLTYITARGNWYYASWKGSLEKSGGIATNIGIHFFDLLLWIFGPVQTCEVHLRTHDRAAGNLVLQQARVRWFLSINPATLPAAPTETTATRKPYRSLQIGEEMFDLSAGFADLHTQSYRAVLANAGFALATVRPAVTLAHQIRTAPVRRSSGIDPHPFCQLPLAPHPFSSRR